MTLYIKYSKITLNNFIPSVFWSTSPSPIVILLQPYTSLPNCLCPFYQHVQTTLPSPLCAVCTYQPHVISTPEDFLFFGVTLHVHCVISLQLCLFFHWPGQIGWHIYFVIFFFYISFFLLLNTYFCYITYFLKQLAKFTLQKIISSWRSEFCEFLQMSTCWTLWDTFF